MYSQNKEDEIVYQYFKGHVGVLLEVGANDGQTFSNSRLLIEKGWTADLVEPSPVALGRLLNFHEKSPNVYIHPYAITSNNEDVILHESGAHVKNGTDISLVSTIKSEEKKRWHDVEFKEVKVHSVDFNTFYDMINSPKIDFISIDAEGYDWDILQQIDLTAVGCKCLCIEWNSRKELAQLYASYCHQHGLKEIHRNAENIIYGKI